MSWSFRVMVLTVVLVWGLGPQIACFIPDQPLTPHEMDCCEKMAGECGRMDMSCCRTVIRTDVPGITAKAFRNIMPHVDIAPRPVDVATVVPPSGFAEFSIRNN